MVNETDFENQQLIIKANELIAVQTRGLVEQIRTSQMLAPDRVQEWHFVDPETQENLSYWGFTYIVHINGVEKTVFIGSREPGDSDQDTSCLIYVSNPDEAEPQVSFMVYFLPKGIIQTDYGSHSIIDGVTSQDPERDFEYLKLCATVSENITSQIQQAISV